MKVLVHQNRGALTESMAFTHSEHQEQFRHKGNVPEMGAPAAIHTAIQ
jgi:hypothetical protein